MSGDPLLADSVAEAHPPLGRPEGEAAVRLARATLERGFLGEPPRDPAGLVSDLALPPRFREAHGVFVSLHTFPERELRGCVGYALALHPLALALPRLAWAAATDDPRFAPMSAGELGRVTVEVSFLTAPELVEVGAAEELPGRIVPGRDGLIVRIGAESGLLLPQVAVEQGWDAERFLSESCVKAGFPPEAWRWPGTRVYRFESRLWFERSPGGEVVAPRERAVGGPAPGTSDPAR